MNSIKAYNHIKTWVDDALKEWKTYNEPQRLYLALQIVDLLGKIEDAAIYLSAMEYLRKQEDLYLMVMKYA